MKKTLHVKDVANVVRELCMADDVDEAAKGLILAMGAQLLDVSPNSMAELSGIPVSGKVEGSYTAGRHSDRWLEEAAHFHDRAEAISFAEEHGWDAVWNEETKQNVWRREDDK